MSTAAERAVDAGMVPDHVAVADARLPQMFLDGDPPTSLYARPVLDPPEPGPVNDEVEVEPDPESPLLEIVDSPHLFDVPSVNLVDSIILTPASYATWTACFAANTSKLEFLLTPGDYTSWGNIDSYNRPGGTAERYRAIRYYDAATQATHPVLRAADKQAYLGGIKITGPLSCYWIVQGVWCNGSPINCGTSLETTNVVFDYCVFEESVIYGLRMNATQNSYVQRCVIRNLIQGGEVGGDMVGIQLKNSDTLPDFDTVGNFILDNVIYNTGDCIGFTEAVTMFQPVQARIEGNDLFITSDQYIGATNETIHENAIDLKAGSDDDQTIIKNNRIWGFRRNNIPTSLGESIVIQKFARNIRIEGNVVADCPRALKDENWPTDTHTITADATTNQIRSVAHHLTTGNGPFILKNSGGTYPGGTDGVTQYWAIYIDVDHFKLATSRANALAGTFVDLTTAGAGTNYWKLYSAATRNITIIGNDFCDIRDLATLDAGAVWKPITNIAYQDNYIARSTYLCDISPTQYWGPPTFTGNVLSEVTAIQRPEDQTPALPYVPASNTNLGTPAAGYERYERIRWLGTEIAARAKPWIP